MAPSDRRTDRRLDWRGLMEAGLHRLQLQPEVFWRLTPIELKIMLGAELRPKGLTRARLDELSAAFPDLKKGQDSNGDDSRDRSPGRLA